MAVTNSLKRLKEVAYLLTRRIYGEFSQKQLTILLEVAEHEKGLTMSELVKLTRIPQGTVSKNIKTLSTYFKRDKDNPEEVLQVGLGLIDKKADLFDQRTVVVTLTPKGEDVVNQLKITMGDE